MATPHPTSAFRERICASGAHIRSENLEGGPVPGQTPWGGVKPAGCTFGLRWMVMRYTTHDTTFSVLLIRPLAPAWDCLVAVRFVKHGLP